MPERLDHIQLEQLDVATNCPADWNSMTGDDRVRHCQQCKLNVYNLSGMSRKEAEELVSTSEGRLCIRFYRRADGTVITEDCPVGLRMIRNAWRKTAAVVGLVCAYLAAPMSYAQGDKGAGCEKAATKYSGDIPPPYTISTGALRIRPKVPEDPNYDKAVAKLISDAYFSKWKEPGPKVQVRINPDGKCAGISMYVEPGIEPMDKKLRDLRDLIPHMQFPTRDLEPDAITHVDVDLSAPVK